MSEEATERVITCVTPDILKPESSVGKNTVGIMTTRTSASFPEGEAKPIPNYLRTTSSSCLDFCKYGKKHDLEVKKRRPIHRRLISNKETTLDVKNQVSTAVATQSERGMKENVKLVASQDKSQSTKKPVANRLNDLPPEKIILISDISTESVIQASDLPPEKIIQVSNPLADSRANLTVGSAQAFLDMNFGFGSIVETPASVFGHEPANQADRSSEESISIEQMTPITISTRNESDEHISTEPSELSSENPTSIKLKATESSDDYSEFAPKNACGSEGTEEDSSMKQEGTLPTALVTARSIKKEGKKVTCSTIDAETKKDINKLQGKVIGARERPKVIRKAKADTSLESTGKQKTTPTSRNSVFSIKTENKRKISTSIMLVTPIVKNKASSTGGLAQKNHEKTVKVLSSLDRGAEKALKQSLKSLSMISHSNSAPSKKVQVHCKLSPMSPGKSQTRAGKLGVTKRRSDFSEPKSEKINLKTYLKQKSPLSSAKGGGSGSKFETDKSTLRKEVTRRTSGVVLRSEINRQPRRTSSVHSAEKISPAHKLKFSRGKVVSLQPDTNLLRILRFRRAKAESQSVKGDLDTKEYRNRSGRIGAVSKSPIPKAPTVILRHQNVQEKKDAQGLLNEVIEETASKLVETRKSKVKALVGAFETVISLQESKVAPVPVPGTARVA